MIPRPRKRLGQNFLQDGRILRAEADAAKLGPDDTVLEIGPGDGRLTRVLAERAGKVVAIEKDTRFADALKELPGNVEVLFGDATKMPLPPFNKVVANIPYNISSKITFRLLERGFDLAVISFQKEFAERLVAGPGSREWGRLGATISFLAEARVERVIPAGAYFPKPKVDSALVVLRPKEKPADWAGIKGIIDVLFTHPTKTVKNALGRRYTAHFPLAEKRVRKLTPDDILEIRGLLAKKPI